jgi:hypothetical protein
MYQVEMAQIVYRSTNPVLIGGARAIESGCTLSAQGRGELLQHLGAEQEMSAALRAKIASVQ